MHSDLSSSLCLEDAIWLVLLDDALADLDKPVTVRCEGKIEHEGVVKKGKEVLKEILAERGDPKMMCPGRVEISL